MELYRMNELEQQIMTDHHWAMTAAEVQQHQGKFVIVRNKRVVTVGDDEEKLLALATEQEKCPTHELVAVFVYPPELWETPH